MFGPKPCFARFLFSKFKREKELSYYGGRERKLTNQYSMMKFVIFNVNEFHLTRKILFRSFSLNLTEKDKYSLGIFLLFKLCFLFHLLTD